MQKRYSAGEFGVTAKYWMVYVRIIDLIHQLHFATNINDYYLLKLSFTMNKQNYPWYGTYYLTQMGTLDSTHPGTHEEIQEKGISVCRNNTGVQQSIDGTGEQTSMRNSKTAGNYISFLMCCGETFSEEVNIFLFAVLGPHEIVLSRTTRIYVILVYIIQLKEII